MKTNLNYSLRRRKISNLVDLVLQQARAGLRAEASRGYLGVLWWVIEPIMYMSVFYIAFAHILNRGDKSFVVFLLTGLIVWKWFHSTLNTGSNSLLANANLMNQVYVPKIVFPLTNIAVNTFKFIIILILLLVFLQFASSGINWAWLLLPILIFTQLFLIVAVTCLFAAVMPFFPDLRIIIDNVLMMMLFVSGIIYDIGKLPENLQEILMLNPMAILIGMYRNVLIEGIPMNWLHLVSILAFSALIMTIAAYIFHRFDKTYPKIVL